MAKLELSSEERMKVASIAKENKFDTKGLTILYTEDLTAKMYYFVKSYRFIVNVKNSMDPEDANTKSIYDKFKIFLESKEVFEVYSRIYSYLEKLKLTTAYHIYLIRKKLINVYTVNQVLIDEVIDFVYELGKVLKKYDPSKTQGYY